VVNQFELAQPSHLHCFRVTGVCLVVEEGVGDGTELKHGEVGAGAMGWAWPGTWRYGGAGRWAS
jgi:hypothetical protein